MNALLTVFTKAFILPFYRSHAGLLLFVFFVMFGTVESNQLVNYHRSLIEATLTTPLFRLGVFIVWLLYGLKIIHSLLKLFRLPHYTFIHQLALLSKSKLFGWMLIVFLACFIPVLAYSFFIYQFGIQYGYYEVSTGIFLCQLVLCLFSAGFLTVFLSTQHTLSWSLVSHVRLPALYGRLGIYTQHIFHAEKLAIGISKVFSLALLYIVKEVLETGDDFRIIGIAWLFALLAHTFIVLKLKFFEDQHLLWVKSLPLSTFKTWTLYTIFYTALIIPEWILLAGVVNKGLTLYYYILLPLLSGAWLTFAHAYLLKPDRDVNQFTTWLFWFFLLSFILVLFKGVVVLIFVLGLLSCFLIHKRYYAYEPPQL